MTINTFFRIHHFKAAIRLEVGFYCRHAYSHAASIAKNLNKHTEEHAQQLLQHCCKNETKLKTFFPLKKKKRNRLNSTVTQMWTRASAQCFSDLFNFSHFSHSPWEIRLFGVSETVILEQINFSHFRRSCFLSAAAFLRRSAGYILTNLTVMFLRISAIRINPRSKHLVQTALLH